MPPQRPLEPGFVLILLPACGEGQAATVRPSFDDALAELAGFCGHPPEFILCFLSLSEAVRVNYGAAVITRRQTARYPFHFVSLYE